MSFGDLEANTSGELADDSYFQTPQNHTPVTFVAATGDNGTPGSYPAFSPNVLAVGATYLSLSGGSYDSESPSLISGGGESTVEPEPFWQQSVQQSGDPSIP